MDEWFQVGRAVQLAEHDEDDDPVIRVIADINMASEEVVLSDYRKVRFLEVQPVDPEYTAKARHIEEGYRTQLSRNRTGELRRFSP